MIIYKATNVINNKVYIGATIRTLEARKKAHINAAFKRNIKRYFYESLRKYGLEQFTWEAIDNADDYNELMIKEKYWIKKYNAFGDGGYNLCVGGNNTLGYKHTEEAKAKFRELAKKRKSLKGKNSPSYGKTLSQETKQKLSDALKGEKKSNVW